MKTLKTLTAAALSAAIAFGTFGTAQAAPIAPKISIAPGATGADVQEVQYRRGRRRAYRRGYRAARRDFRGRPYRYRRSRGAGVAAGVIGGLAVGAIIANSARPAPRYVAPRRVYRTPRRFSAAHHGWCSSRYRSYRAYDGTFQPYNGPRRLCSSPYLR